MPEVKMVTIKNRYNGFTRTVGEPEFNNMIDKADYEVVTLKEEKPKQKAKPKAKKSKKK